MNAPPSAAAPPLDPDQLRAEAAWLHQCLFGAPPPPHVTERFVAAHAVLRLAGGIDVQRIVARRLDAEAIELWARRRDPLNPLTQKLRTLLYLVEIEAPYYHHFVRHRGGFWSALPWLVFCPLRSLGKLARGALLARRHGVG